MVTMSAGQPMPQTVVVIQGQGQFQPGDWEESLFGCLSDIPSCLLTCFCSCVQYGQNYEAIHHDGCITQGCIYACLMSCGLQCCVHQGLRGHIRQKFNIFGGGMGDCLATWCCPCCSLTQEAREIKYRRHEAAAKGIAW